MVAAIALVQVVVPFLLITFGEDHIDSQLAGILVSAAPIFTALLALAFDHDERSQGWAAVGIVVGMLGVVLLFGLDLSGSSDQVVGGLMVLLASLGYAAGALLLKHSCPARRPSEWRAGRWPWPRSSTLPLLPGRASRPRPELQGGRRARAARRRRAPASPSCGSTR